MLLFILILVALFIALLIRAVDESFFWGLVIGGVISAFILMFVVSITWKVGWGAHEYKAQREDLRAVSAASAIHGEFYLGSGYIGSERAVNYVSTVGGESFLRQLPAGKTAIIEDTPKEKGPYKVTLCESYDNPWVLPWVIEREADSPVKYEFHIPPGSVTGDFTIDNTK